MFKYFFTAVPIAVVLCAQDVQATDTADLHLVGRILPATCTIGLSAANVSYLTLPKNRLNAGTSTEVTPGMTGTKPTTVLNISCDAAAQVAMTIQDNSAASVASSVLNVLSGKTSADLFGLGADDASAPIGAFTLSSTNVVVNSATGKALESTDGVTWNSAGGKVKNTAGWIMSWTTAGGTAPAAITSIAQTLELSAAIMPMNTLNTSQPIHLQGSVTMELVYL